MTLKKRLLALCMAVVMVFSLCSISAFAAAPTDDKQPVVIGRYDAPLSECLEPGMAMQELLTFGLIPTQPIIRMMAYRFMLNFTFRGTHRQSRNLQV